MICSLVNAMPVRRPPRWLGASPTISTRGLPICSRYNRRFSRRIAFLYWLHARSETFARASASMKRSKRPKLLLHRPPPGLRTESVGELVDRAVEIGHIQLSILILAEGADREPRGKQRLPCP